MNNEMNIIDTFIFFSFFNLFKNQVTLSHKPFTLTSFTFIAAINQFGGIER